MAGSIYSGANEAIDHNSDEKQKFDSASYEPSLTGEAHEFDYQTLESGTNRAIAELAVKYGVNQRKLMLKQDLCIIPAICILYLLAFLDRVNLGNAAVYGMSKELDLPPNSNKYNNGMSIFFVTYVVFEIPSNFLLKKFRPSIWLPLCMVLFGVCCLCMGFIHTYGQFLALRCLLGFFESGMFPGCFYLLACWYRREEAQKRYTFFFSSTSLAGAFGGLIAYGVNRWDGAKGYSSWRWLFILEGSITVFCAFCMFFLIADFPEDAKFLKENERAFIKEKLALDQGQSHAEDKVRISSLFRVFGEWKVWCVGVMYFGVIVAAYAYAFFAPTIIKGFGYSNVQTQIYSIFPWITTFGVGMIWAIMSDYFKHRYLFTLWGALMGVIGFAMLLGLDAFTLDGKTPVNVHARYATCFLICVGMYGSMPIIVCWANMNFSGHYRKMVGSAWQVGFGNIGGIVSTYIFLAKESKSIHHQYVTGYSVSLAMIIVSMIACLVYLCGIFLENKHRREGKAQLKWEAKSERAKREGGDLNPRFIYQY